MIKCSHCNKEIDESIDHEVTAPDGDCFHVGCLPLYEKEREIFFSDIIHDDDKYNKWMNN